MERNVCMPTTERFKDLQNYGLACRLVDVMTGARFRTRAYTSGFWRSILHLTLFTCNILNINTLHSVRYLQTHLTLACTRTKTKVYDGQRASECSVRPSEFSLARYWFYALPQQILRLIMQVGQLCKMGVGRV